MSLKDQTLLRVVLYEGRGCQSWESAERFAAMSALLAQGFALTRVTGDRPVASSDRSTHVVLSRGNGTPPFGADASAAGVRFQDITGLPTARVVEAVKEAQAEAKAARHGEWKPWFPVIDYDRCTNCMQCLSFCLFGVYGADAQQHIEVQNPECCKTNCPACSRVCPEAAIMFPKYKAGPINGDLVQAADLAREKMKIDISALLGGDVYNLLRERSERAKSRFSKERDSGKALEERKKCLAKLAQAAEIPPEVLMSLPSMDEIKRRAEEAKAKAQAALKSLPGNAGRP